MLRGGTGSIWGNVAKPWSGQPFTQDFQSTGSPTPFTPPSWPFSGSHEVTPRPHRQLASSHILQETLGFPQGKTVPLCLWKFPSQMVSYAQVSERGGSQSPQLCLPLAHRHADPQALGQTGSSVRLVLAHLTPVHLPLQQESPQHSLQETGPNW